MKDYAVINQKWWNKVTPIHKDSTLYNLDSFKKGKTSLQEPELTELTDVKGKTLLHLMCHFGMDTLSWSRKGAVVTGVDLSNDAITLAQNLSDELKIPARFIRADIFNLKGELDETFDIVFTSYGVLCWVSDIKAWAKLISEKLKPGGIFYISEVHPFCNILSVDFELYYNYFKQGPYKDDSEGTYTDWNAKVKGVTYEWSYTISDVINSLLEVGLSIEFIHEFPYTMYDQFPGYMKKNSKGQYVLKDKQIKIPLLFSLKATKR